MNRQQLIDAIVDQTGESKAVVDRVLSALIDTVQSTVATEKVTLVGFGVFSATLKNARTGRNPQTGEPINISAVLAPKFTPGKEFRKVVDSQRVL